MADITVVAANLDITWTLIAAPWCFSCKRDLRWWKQFHQGKKCRHIIMKNLMDFACGTVVFWAIGFV